MAATTPEAPALADPDSLSQSPAWRRTFASLENVQFRTFWAGQLFSFTALHMKQVAWGYLAYDITGSAKALGLVSVANWRPCWRTRTVIGCG